MPKTELDGDQILDDSIQSVDIQDGTVNADDVDITTVGKSLIKCLRVAGVGLTQTYTGADEGTGEVQITLDAGGFGTDYYAFQEVSLSETTSNNWVQKANWITPIVSAGRYVIHYKAQLTNSQKKQVGFQVNYIEDGGSPVEIEASFNEPTNSNVFETRSAFEEVVLAADGTIGVEVNWGQTDSGGIGKIQKVAVYVFKVGEV